MEGLVFPNVTWLDRFPDNIEIVTYGLDFGYTQDPTALVQVGRDGMSIYLRKLLYTPIDNANDLSATIKQLIPEEAHIWADSADPGMIADLRVRGIKCLPVKKYSGSVQYGIDLLKRFKIHIVRDNDARKEQENYRWRYIGGVPLNQPEDKFNHFWDAARYAAMSEFRLP
jgi:phage terminase large subunit